MKKNVFETFEEARAHEEGNKRVYRVSNGKKTLYAVALSPAFATAYAAPLLGITAELAEPRHYLRQGQTVDEIVKALTPEQRKVLRHALSS